MGIADGHVVISNYVALFLAISFLGRCNEYDAISRQIVKPILILEASEHW